MTGKEAAGLSVMLCYQSRGPVMCTTMFTCSTAAVDGQRVVLGVEFVEV